MDILKYFHSNFNLHNKMRLFYCLFFVILTSVNIFAKEKMSSLACGFIKNNGQILTQKQTINSNVLYALSLPGMNVNLTKNGFSYDTWKAIPKVSNAEDSSIKRITMDQSETIYSYNFHRVDVEFININKNCIIEHKNQSKDYLRYFTAGTPANGIVAYHYKSIVYKNLYEGIDLEFVAALGTEKPVEYNFIVRAGADLSQIKMRYSGAEQASIKDGSLVLKLVHNDITENIPASWFEKSKKPIKVNYKMIARENNDLVIGFDAGGLEKGENLIIDPAPSLRWGTYYGGDLLDQINAVSSFGANDLYIGGVTQSPAGIATSGAYISSYGGGVFDGYVAKFDTAGVRQWGTYFGGPDQERVFSVNADNLGNVYAAGNTESVINVATAGSHQTTNAGNYDGFLAKFDANGAIVWATYYGGLEEDRLNSVNFDGLGNVLVCGATQSSNNISTTGAHQSSLGSVGSFDGMVIKFTPSGLRQWGTYYGGLGYDELYSIAADAAGEVYTTGVTGSSSSISSTTGFQLNFGGGISDGFVVKFTGTGVRQWSTYYGGLLEDALTGISLDNGLNVYVSGTTSSNNNIASTGAFQTANAGGNYDGFIVKLNAAGTREWATFFGGDDDDRIFNNCAYNSGGLLITGLSGSASGIATAGTYQSSTAGSGDAYIVLFNSSGFREWGTYYGGTSQEVGFCVEESQTGDIYICGFTQGIDGISTPNAHQVNSGGGILDGFLARFSSCIALQLPIITSNSPICYGGNINLTAAAVPNATYFWTGPNGFSSNLQNPIITGVNGSASGDYSLTITTADCSSPTATISIVIEPIPVANINAGSPICAQDTCSFVLTSTAAFSQTSWSFGDPGSGSNNSSSSLAPVHVFQNVGSYLITVIVTFDCITDTFLTNVNVSPNPVSSVSSVPGTCGQPNGTATATATGGSGNYAYTWSNGATGSFISGLTSGSYSVIATDQNGCSSTSQVVVSTSPAAGVTLIAGDTIIGLNETATLEIVGGDSFNWSPATGLNCTDCPTVIASPQSSTIYTVTGTDSIGCPYIRVVNVVIDIVCNELFVPDIFSPNGIGNPENEKLCVYSNCIKTMDFGIYNRWGELIFSTNNQNDCWDGNHKGVPVMTGVYTYRLFVEQLDGEKIEKTGTITLSK